MDTSWRAARKRNAFFVSSSRFRIVSEAINAS
jgi:hypothetical protein